MISLRQESVIVADSIVDSLMYAGIITHDDDSASHLIAEKFLLFRASPEADLPTDSDLLPDASNLLANMLIDRLIAKHIISGDHRLRAVEIATEEIIVRWSMESLRS